jgi:ferredoxin-NADP reductase
MSDSAVAVKVKAIQHEADGIHSFELRAADGSSLPPFTAGAHITVEMTNQLSRSYSLVNSQEERHRYVIAVSRDRNSRGGSSYMHDSVRVGQALRVSTPRNNFPLHETAKRTLLIAGGIGITPLWSMVQRLGTLGADWALCYAARSRSAAAFLDAMVALGPVAMNRIRLHFDDEADGRPLDLAKVLDVSPEVHVYCCGPLPMLRAFEVASASRPSSTVHSEYFSAPEAAAEGGFIVRLARNGSVIRIPDRTSILDELIKRQIDVPYSCKEGTCGTCEVRVLHGTPDHRDVVLTDEERRSNSKMMICCSGSLGPELELDI